MNLDKTMNAADRELERYNRLNNVPGIRETPISRGVAKLQETLAEARLELQNSGLDKFKRAELNGKLQEAARAEMARIVAAERDRLTLDLAAEKLRIDRDRTRNREALDRAARDAAIRYSAMSSQELEIESRRILESGNPVDPSILDLLSSELRIVDPQGHKFFREQAASQRLYETERFTEAGKRLTGAIDTLAHFADGSMVPIEFEDGSFSAMPIGEAIGGLE